MKTLLIILNLLIHSLSRIVILMTVIHFLFTISFDHAIIISIALSSMFISEIFLSILVTKESK